jgi:hypothetical protein
MSNNSDEQDVLARACELVGRFLYHFGLVERKIDEAVIKLLDLSEKLAPVVTAIDFARKLRLVKLSADTQITDPAEKEKRMTSAEGCTRSMMTERLLPTPTSTLLQMEVCSLASLWTKEGRVLPLGPLWRDTQFDASYNRMRALEAELDQLIKLLKPSEPAVNWFIPGLIPQLPAYLQPASLWVPSPPIRNEAARDRSSVRQHPPIDLSRAPAAGWR